MNVTRSDRQPPSSPPQDAAALLEEVFARHGRELLGTLYYIVGNAEDARDALQEAFLKCWRRRDSVPAVENLKAWVFQVAVNAGRDLRGSAWQRRRTSLGEREPMLTSRDSHPEDVAERTEELDRLRHALADLRDEEKEVFLLRQNADLTYDEIATALGIPIGTVKTRMRLALARLREVLAPS